MKTIQSKMNKLRILSIVVFCLVISSCQNNDPLVITASEERAAEIIATSLAYNTYGMAANVNYVSNEVSNLLECNQQNTHSGINQYVSPFGGVTSSFQFIESYNKVCSSEEIINYSTTAFQDIDAVFFTSQQDVNASFTVSGLEDTAAIEQYSGLYSREGNWYSKIYNDRLEVEYVMNFDNLRVSKTSYFIISGTSTFNMIIGYSETPDTTSFNGNVTFLNEDEAQIDFNNGNSYLLNLETGEIRLI